MDFISVYIGRASGEQVINIDLSLDSDSLIATSDSIETCQMILKAVMRLPLVYMRWNTVYIAQYKQTKQQFVTQTPVLSYFNGVSVRMFMLMLFFR